MTPEKQVNHPMVTMVTSDRETLISHLLANNIAIVNNKARVPPTSIINESRPSNVGIRDKSSENYSTNQKYMIGATKGHNGIF